MRTAISALFLCFSLAATAQEVPDFDVHGFASYTLANAPKHDIGLGVSYRNDYFDVQGLLMDTRDGPYQLSGIRYLYVETQKKLGEASGSDESDCAGNRGAGFQHPVSRFLLEVIHHRSPLPH